MTLGYWTFLLMIIPALAAGLLWLKFHTIDIKESLSALGIGLLLVLSTLLMSKCSMSSDTETISGRIVSVHHTPEWKAEWEELETYTTTDADGNTEEHTRMVTKRETHSPKWWAETTIGEITLKPGYFNYICKEHGQKKELGHRPDYDSGDRYDYWSNVKDNPEFPNYPVNLDKWWSNPLKGSGGLHAYADMSEEEVRRYRLPAYPKNDPFKSSRLVGSVPLSIWDLDKANAAIGQQCKVNIIIVRLDGGMETAKRLQQYWKNGKKNDLILCYGGTNPAKAEWSYVFGWSETELVKMNLQTILLENTIDKPMLDLVKAEIRKNFRPHPWDRYEDEPFQVPTWSVVTAFILMLISQVALYIIFHREEIFAQTGVQNSRFLV